MLPQTSLDLTSLSAAAQRALGPGPGRTMAARGMMPLPPIDQVTVLYQLSLDPDTSISQSARMTASALPEKLLLGTLAEGALDARVLDFFGLLVLEKPALFDVVVLNPSVADQTLATMAAKAGAREIDQIAQNEQRLLRHPEIIAAMYMNRRARMSTIDRVVELAVRNHVRVPGLACWDEVARALTGGSQSSADADALFAHAASTLSGDDAVITTGDADQPLPEDEKTPELPAEKVAGIAKLSIPAKIRLATLGNAFARSTLIRDPIRMVAVAAVKSPGMTDIEAARYAGNQGLAEDVIRYIASNRSWTKLYAVKMSLCRNPKAPISETVRLLPFLREKDLQGLIKSRGVASALVAQARKLQLQRKGGK